MEEINFKVTYKVLGGLEELPLHLQSLLKHAREAVSNAYAPYSEFRVGAAALMSDNSVVTGSNQENAASPAGICAERVTLSAAVALHPGVAVTSLAISAKARGHVLNEPAAPCGICRQTILEYEQRFHNNIEIVLQGEQGKIIWINSVKDLLPLFFSKEDLI